MHLANTLHRTRRVLSIGLLMSSIGLGCTEDLDSGTFEDRTPVRVGGSDGSDANTPTEGLESGDGGTTVEVEDNGQDLDETEDANESGTTATPPPQDDPIQENDDEANVIRESARTNEVCSPYITSPCDFPSDECVAVAEHIEGTLCRARCDIDDDCADGESCAQLYDDGSSETSRSLSMSLEADSIASIRVCLPSPDTTALWRLNIDYVQVDDAIWDIDGSQPDILLCITDGLQNRICGETFEDTLEVFYPDISEDYVTAELSAVTITVIDDDFAEGFIPGQDEIIASSTFDLVPGSDIESGDVITLVGDSSSFGDDNGYLEQIVVSLQRL